MCCGDTAICPDKGARGKGGPRKKSAAALIRILCMEIREPEKDWSPETLCCSIVNDRTCSNNCSGIDYQRLAVMVLRVVGVQIRLGGHRRTFCQSVTKGGMCSNKAQ